jgi:hypothetical protein
MRGERPIKRLAQWKMRPWRPEFGPAESILYLEKVYFLFWGGSEAAMGGGAQLPVSHVNEPKKTGVRSAAKTH